jgi:hypothetical protein
MLIYTSIVGALLLAKAGIVVEIAPPPRPLFRPMIFTAKVVEINDKSISVRGLYMIVTGVMKAEDRTNGMNPKMIQTGEAMLVWGSFPSMRATKVVSIPWVGSIVTTPDGLVHEILINEQPLRTYEVCEALELGVFAENMIDMYTYRISDVKVGDIVQLRFLQSDYYINVIHGICIYRRPGGKIPPAPGEKDKQGIRYHERMQARQDWEEKSIPIPMKFLSPKDKRERIAPAPHPKP